MAMEFDRSMPPLKAQAPPAVPIEMLVAVAVVTMSAGDVPRGILREFYTRVLGLTFVIGDGDAGRICFLHQQRQIVLERERREVGRLGLLIRNFGEALMKLRERRVPFELMHGDDGLTRAALLRDPAGNWIQLIETRAF